MKTCLWIVLASVAFLIAFYSIAIVWKKQKRAKNGSPWSMFIEIILSCLLVYSMNLQESRFP
jgi:hypothetical protein